VVSIPCSRCAIQGQLGHAQTTRTDEMLQ
jgi:hypothetical protein